MTRRTEKKVSEGWRVAPGPGGCVHVYPINDLRDHLIDDCWCSPADDDGVIQHHSLDHREEYERGERGLS